MWIPDIIRNREQFQRDIIKSGSGISSKSYVMVEGMKISKLIIYWYLIVLTIEMFTDYVLRSSWLDFVAVIGALSALILAAAWGKTKSEQAYYRRYNYDSDSQESGEPEDK